MKDPRFPIESLSRDRDNDLFTDNRSIFDTDDYAKTGTNNTRTSNTGHPSEETRRAAGNFAANNDPLSSFQNYSNERTDRRPYSDSRASSDNRANSYGRANTNTFDFSGATLDNSGQGPVSNGSGRSNGNGPGSRRSNGNGPSGGPPGKNGKNVKIGKNGKPINKKVVIIKRILLIALIVFLVGCLGVGGFIWASVKDMPEWTPDAFDHFSFSSFVYDKDGNQIAQLSLEENRLHFTYDEVPPLLAESLLAVEDQRFYKHFGFDPLRILRGAVNTVINPNKPEGGSTITTQLAKNTFIQVEQRTSGGMKGVQRKVQELFLAMQIERNYEKDEILYAYMTQTYLGHGAFGVRSAAQVYFGKEMEELTPPEIALICGMPQAPGAYDPYVNPESAKNRRNLVLSIMRDKGIITADDYTAYKEEPFTFVDEVKNGDKVIKMGSSSSEKLYPYFVDYVVTCLLDENKYNLTDVQVYKGGLHIHTTVDPAAQQEAENAMKDPANFPNNAKDGTQVQGAIVMLENATGNVVAMVGGREYPEDQQLCFNRATSAQRQPGSCAKPIIVYAPALEKGGFFAGSVLDDIPTTFPGNYKPKNSSGGYSGLITMRAAIRSSVNIYAVKLFQEAGPDYCYNFAKNLGLEFRNNTQPGLAFALGSFSATPIELARAYSAFPNQGLLNEVNCVTKILDNNNRVVLETENDNKRVMKESTAFIMCDLMKDVVDNGTGTRARISNWFVGGKTGTTDSDQYPGGPDVWFTGYTPLYTAAVWMGFDNSDKDHYLASGTYGGDKPAQLWQKVMVKALEGKPKQSIFNKPGDVMDIQFDLFSGMIPSPLTPSDLVSHDLGTPGGMPNRESDVWIELRVDGQNRLIRPGSTAGTLKVFLNMPDRPLDNWPAKELPYKPPGEYSTDEEREDEPGNATVPVYAARLSGNTVTFTTTLPKNTIYKIGYLYLHDSDKDEWLPSVTITNLSNFKYTIPDYLEGADSYRFQLDLFDNNGRPASPLYITVP
ncbi:MAG: PBP1A family penicillin-binding protein [Peptococcaceae bacterium]|nr:PBP1A family penicillin-binding protein [Peptococcaceae bacterium]